MPGDCVVRVAVEEDSRGCVEVLLERFNFQRKTTEDYLYQKMLKKEVLVAVNDEGVIGVLTYKDRFHGNNIYVQHLVVSREHRRQGIGSILLKEIGNWGEENFRSSLTLETEDTNEPAQQFYEKHGFEKTGANENPQKPGERMIIYSLKLYKI
ncbi:GNAT family N-acetyltransferase [Candidatus Altiarchaeota archaeon]